MSLPKIRRVFDKDPECMKVYLYRFKILIDVLVTYVNTTNKKRLAMLDDENKSKKCLTN